LPWTDRAAMMAVLVGIGMMLVAVS